MKKGAKSVINAQAHAKSSGSTEPFSDESMKRLISLLAECNKGTSKINPVEHLIRIIGLTAMEFSTIFNCKYKDVCDCLSGRATSIPTAVKKAMVNVWKNFELIESLYTDWNCEVNYMKFLEKKKLEMIQEASMQEGA